MNTCIHSASHGTVNSVNTRSAYLPLCISHPHPSAALAPRMCTERVAAVFAYDVGRLAHLLANDSDRSPDLAGAQSHHHWRCALLGRANRLERRVESSGASSSGAASGRRGLHHVGRGRRVRPWPTCPGEKSQIQVVFMNTLYSAVYSATAQIHV